MKNLKNKILTGVAAFGLASGAFAGDKASATQNQPVSKAAPSAKVAHKKAANQNKYKLKAGEVKVLDMTAKKYHGKEGKLAQMFSKGQLVVLVSIPEKGKADHFDRGYFYAIKDGVEEHVKGKSFGAYVIRTRDGDNDLNTVAAIPYHDGKEGKDWLGFQKDGRDMMVPEQRKVIWQHTKKTLEKNWKERYKDSDKVSSLSSKKDILTVADKAPAP